MSHFIHKISINIDAVMANPRIAQEASSLYWTHQELMKLFCIKDGEPRPCVHRELRPGHHHVVSSNPAQPSALWVVESRPYDPQVVKGQVLQFTLRGNPTIRVRDAEGCTRHKDPVRMARFGMTATERQAIPMEQTALEEGMAWLERKGSLHGFQVLDATLNDYESISFSKPGKRGKEARTITLASMDFTGLLRIEDLPQFKKALWEGVGRSKAFGYGLLRVMKPLHV